MNSETIKALKLNSLYELKQTLDLGKSSVKRVF